MNEVIEILTLVFLILVILYIYYKILFRIVSFVSNRTTVLIDFLEKKNLMFEEVHRPNNNKKKNPFKHDDNYFMEVLFPYSIISNRIVVASNKNGNLKYFWLQKKVFWFKKPEYEFKEINLKESEKVKNTKKNKIIIVKDFCPACKSKLEPNEKSCKECGLNFM
jgi:hypothetical protein